MKVTVKEGIRELFSGNRDVKLVISVPLGEIMNAERMETYCEVPDTEPAEEPNRNAGQAAGGLLVIERE